MAGGQSRVQSGRVVARSRLIPLGIALGAVGVGLMLYGSAGIGAALMWIGLGLIVAHGITSSEDKRQSGP